jgi:hypothetical protein
VEYPFELTLVFTGLKDTEEIAVPRTGNSAGENNST